MILFLFLLGITANSQSFSKIEPDYIKANKNTRKYTQVPKGELIWIKYAAIEPLYFYEGPLRGKGWHEPIDNAMILKLREHENVYVDYFTDAKEGFYRRSAGYEVCGSFKRTFKNYKTLVQESFKRNFSFYDKKEGFALPHNITPAISVAGFTNKKKHLFTKHLFPGTSVYNVKSLLDDPELYTAQITNQASAIKEFIYIDSHLNLTIKPIYKKRIYDFVASNAIQLTHMLRLNRMDWVDMDFTGNFYAKKLNIGPEAITFHEISSLDPNKITLNESNLYFFVCHGSDLNKVKKRLEIINGVVKGVLSQFSVMFSGG